MIKVYIAGKITGDPNYKEKFAQYERALTGNGHAVLNPAVMPEGLTQAEYMRLSLTILDIADVAVFLPGWEESEGAKVECAYCLKVGKPMQDWGARLQQRDHPRRSLWEAKAGGGQGTQYFADMTG